MKKTINIGIIILTIILVSSLVVAQDVCCERTTSGFWCQNTDSSNCDASYHQTPTSCDSTSYCKLGCCYDQEEGLCMENTAQRVCEDEGGSWNSEGDCNIPQCTLGCCILIDQGAFVTLQRCKSMAGLYEIDADFRSNIGNEVECIAAAQAKEKGACVIEVDYGRTCVFTTRDQCDEGGVQAVNGTITNASMFEFHGGLLCSAPDLATNCGKSRRTTLLSGKDEVYYTDTCGNPANIYNSNEFNNNNYWTEVYDKSKSCNYGQSNANNPSCGNCDYFLGSIGREADRTTNTPSHGDYICVDLNCDNGKRHGESWCALDPDAGSGKDRVGSRHYKNLCINGEILVEACADFRGEVCSEIITSTGYKEAGCRVNRHQTCMSQVEKEDCENTNLRDCIWAPGYYFTQNSVTTDETAGYTFASATGIQISTNDSNQDGDTEDKTPQGLCIPYYPPGFQFWTNYETESGSQNSSLFGVTSTGTVNSNIADPENTCSEADTKFEVKFRKETVLAEKLFGDEEDWECEGDTYTGNKEICNFYENGKLISTPTDWISDMNEICAALGDCGGYVNYVNEETTEGYAAYDNTERIAGTGGAEILPKKKKGSGTTSEVVTGFSIRDILNRVIGGK